MNLRVVNVSTVDNTGKSLTHPAAGIGIGSVAVSTPSLFISGYLNTVLGIARCIQLTPGTVSDKYELTGRTNIANRHSDTAENIPNLIGHYRKKLTTRAFP